MNVVLCICVFFLLLFSLEMLLCDEFASFTKSESFGNTSKQGFSPSPPFPRFLIPIVLFRSSLVFSSLLLVGWIKQSQERKNHLVTKKSRVTKRKHNNKMIANRKVRWWWKRRICFSQLWNNFDEKLARCVRIHLHHKLIERCWSNRRVLKRHKSDVDIGIRNNDRRSTFDGHQRTTVTGHIIVHESLFIHQTSRTNADCMFFEATTRSWSNCRLAKEHELIVNAPKIFGKESQKTDEQFSETLTIFGCPR